MPSAKSRVVKVAVVGGGCAGLSAAWQLSKLNLDESHPDHYAITVYEAAHRLGGKSASSRDKHGRIVEHGLHIWLGFYENAFRLMRECYGEIERRDETPGWRDANPLMHRSFDEAFFPETHVGVAAKNRIGVWDAWTGYFPPMKGAPGEELDPETNPFTMAGYLARMLGLVKTLMQSVLEPAGSVGSEDARNPERRSTLDNELDFGSGSDRRASPNVQVERIAQLVRAGALATAAGMLQAVTILESIVREQLSQPLLDLRVVRYVEAFATHSRRLLSDVVQIDGEIRRKTEIIDLVMTTIVGLYREKVFLDPRGLDALNDMDCRAWLKKHGATDSALQSPFVRGLYDLAFAYRDGDKLMPQLAAGQGLRGALRMFFTYRGAMAWRLRSGSGDVVFAPLYRALKARDVSFEFLHRLQSVEFNPDLSEESENRVVRMLFDVPERADAAAGHSRAPLDDDGCWKDVSDESLFASLGSLRSGQKVVGPDEFDAVIFAMGKDDFVAACQPLCDRLESWKQMSKHVETAATQSVQVWLTKDLAELGWQRGPVILAGIEGTFETWADMTHTLATESKQWAGSAAPRTVAYLCGALPKKTVEQIQAKARTEEDMDRAMDDEVRVCARKFLDDKMGPFWPAVFKGDGKSMEPVFAAHEGVDDPFGEQFFRANYKGSDRFTMALPGTLQYRISPLDYSVVNMSIAGDWTNCGFVEGCIEAAVMSGMLSAHAISGGSPAFDRIIGYDHP
ncbi:FAD-dependent oxidoreductase [Variovorax saccharolyticus]|uniref:FAD-dependent oxidoreductase n=1 Tax=Variovorax saccharolyticus TaxID=3053516 RepID=UPI002574DEF3|nr:FAD-dependent oxidoreductase [Variovorax sp. J31P216]MDM0026342.1 FAD-dependent oxidoreductase [Variovorax sp. J31P216]